MRLRLRRRHIDRCQVVEESENDGWGDKNREEGSNSGGHGFFELLGFFVSLEEADATASPLAWSPPFFEAHAAASRTCLAE